MIRLHSSRWWRAGVAVGAPICRIVLRASARSQRMSKFEEQFPEAIDLMARALRAGHALTDRTSMVADELPEPVGTEFRPLLRPAELRHAAARGAEGVRRPIPALDARVLRDGRADPAGGWRQPVRSARQPRRRYPRALQGEASGPGLSAHGRITGWILSALPPSSGGSSSRSSSRDTYRKSLSTIRSASR